MSPENPEEHPNVAPGRQEESLSANKASFLPASWSSPSIWGPASGHCPSSTITIFLATPLWLCVSSSFM